MSQSINQLNQGLPTTAGQLPFYDPSCGQDRRCSVSDLLALFTTSASGLATLYAAPNVSGYSISVQSLMGSIPLGTNLWLLVTPVADYAALTILLPPGVDQQEIVVSSTHAVSSTLTNTGATIGASPQPVNGAPTTLAAGGHYRLRFDGVTGAWYAI